MFYIHFALQKRAFYSDGVCTLQKIATKFSFAIQKMSTSIPTLVTQKSIIGKGSSKFVTFDGTIYYRRNFVLLNEDNNAK